MTTATLRLNDDLDIVLALVDADGESSVRLTEDEAVRLRNALSRKVMERRAKVDAGLHQLLSVS